MKSPIVLCAALAVLAIQPAQAGNHKAKHQGQGASIAANCPPGLAKKNPPCVPPGQAKKAYDPRYGSGERILRDYRVIRDAQRYGLNQSDLYYLVGREIFRMDRNTGRVIAFIGLADVLLN